MIKLRDRSRWTSTGSRATARVRDSRVGQPSALRPTCVRRHNSGATAVATTRHRLTESDAPRYRDRPRTLFIVLPKRAASQGTETCVEPDVVWLAWINCACSDSSG